MLDERLDRLHEIKPFVFKIISGCGRQHQKRVARMTIRDQGHFHLKVRTEPACCSTFHLAKANLKFWAVKRAVYCRTSRAIRKRRGSRRHSVSWKRSANAGSADVLVRTAIQTRAVFRASRSLRTGTSALPAPARQSKL